MAQEAINANDNGISIETVLDNYRYVNDVQYDNDYVRVGVKERASFYDTDAIIGLLTRRFDLEYAFENYNEILEETFLNFKR